MFAYLIIHCVAADDAVHMSLYHISERADGCSKISFGIVVLFD